MARAEADAPLTTKEILVFTGGLCGFVVVLALLGWFLFTHIGNQHPLPAHPVQQTPGHISGNDLGGGVTAVHVTIDGRRVPCVVMIANQAGGNGPGAGGITCDWSKG